MGFKLRNLDFMDLIIMILNSIINYLLLFDFIQTFQSKKIFEFFIF
jgi:hypothetical protein